MSFETVRRDIMNRLATNWATTRIAWENQPFQPSPGESYVRCMLVEGPVTRISIGVPGYHRHTGTILMMIYTPLNQGTATSRGYAGTLAQIFRDAQFNGITCNEATLLTVGQVGDWWKQNVGVNYYWDGVYTPTP